MLGSKGSKRLGIWQLLFLVTSHSHHFFQVSASVCWNPFILLVGEMHWASKRSHFRTQLNGLGETLGESVRFPVLLLWGFLHLSGEVVNYPVSIGLVWVATMCLLFPEWTPEMMNFRWMGWTGSLARNPKNFIFKWPHRQKWLAMLPEKFIYLIKKFGYFIWTYINDYWNMSNDVFRYSNLTPLLFTVAGLFCKAVHTYITCKS